MTDPDLEETRRIAREIFQSCGDAFEEHERLGAGERQKLLVDADAAAEELGEHPLGSRDLKIPLGDERL